MGAGGRQAGSRLYQQELADMRRAGPIGEFTRRNWRQWLSDPERAISRPEWFRREAERLLKDCEDGEYAAAQFRAIS